MSETKSKPTQHVKRKPTRGKCIKFPPLAWKLKPDGRWQYVKL
jgi:hypothetical protein